MTQTLTPTVHANLASALEAMPIFPLPGMVLLPGALVSLHVFEPRYRSLLADSVATHRCIALASLAEEPTEGTQPRIFAVAGVGVIVEHQALADGRSNIVVMGQARVHLRELSFVPPYRRAHARLLEPRDTSVPSWDLAALRGAALAFATAARRVDRSIEFSLPSGLNAAAAADLCAHHLIHDSAARQRTLEELDVAERVRFVTLTLAEQTALLKRTQVKLD